MDERIMRTIIHVLRTLGRLASCFGMLDRTVRGPQLIRQKGNGRCRRETGSAPD